MTAHAEIAYSLNRGPVVVVPFLRRRLIMLWNAAEAGNQVELYGAMNLELLYAAA